MLIDGFYNRASSITHLTPRQQDGLTKVRNDFLSRGLGRSFATPTTGMKFLATEMIRMLDHITTLQEFTTEQSGHEKLTEGVPGVIMSVLEGVDRRETASEKALAGMFMRDYYGYTGELTTNEICNQGVREYQEQLWKYQLNRLHETDEQKEARRKWARVQWLKARVDVDKLYSVVPDKLNHS